MNPNQFRPLSFGGIKGSIFYTYNEVDRVERQNSINIIVDIDIYYRAGAEYYTDENGDEYYPLPKLNLSDYIGSTSNVFLNYYSVRYFNLYNFPNGFLRFIWESEKYFYNNYYFTGFRSDNPSNIVLLMNNLQEYNYIFANNKNVSFCKTDKDEKIIPFVFSDKTLNSGNGISVRSIVNLFTGCDGFNFYGSTQEFTNYKNGDTYKIDGLGPSMGIDLKTLTTANSAFANIQSGSEYVIDSKGNSLNHIFPKLSEYGFYNLVLGEKMFYNNNVTMFFKNIFTLLNNSPNSPLLFPSLSNATLMLNACMFEPSDIIDIGQNINPTPNKTWINNIGLGASDAYSIDDFDLTEFANRGWYVTIILNPVL